MDDQALTDADATGVQFLLNVGGAIRFDNDEIAAASRIDGHSPLRPRHSSTDPHRFDGDPEAGARALAARGALDGDQLAPWVVELWRAITRPNAAVIVDRTSDAGQMIWVYGVTAAGFAEQWEQVDGCGWMFGSTAQLLGRVMLTAGVLRAAREPAYASLDPLPAATEWTSRVSVASSAWPDSVSEPRAEVFAFRDGTHVALDGSPLDGATVVARLERLLGLVPAGE